MDKRSNKIYCYLHPDAHLIDDYDAGDIICPRCGLVVVDRVIDIFIDSRSCSPDDQRLVRSYVGSPENKLLSTQQNLSTAIKPRSETNFPKSEVKKDSLLKYANCRTYSAKDQYLIYGFKEISIMADRINLPRIIVDRAQHLLKLINNENILRGRSYYAIAAACLYIACRIENGPRTYKEICAISNTSKKEIGHCFKRIIRALNTPVKQINPSDFISRFCCNLNLPYYVQQLAVYISKKVANIEDMMGRSPVSLAAASIYLASSIANQPKKRKEICEVCGISESTLSTVYRILQKCEIEYKSMEKIDRLNF